MANVYIGTSGYSYQDWIGCFYPDGTPEKDFLACYAAAFPFVELNFSYYSMPAAGLLERLTEKVGPSFLFAIKAHKSLTHEITDRLEKDLDDYKKGIDPLLQRQKLAAVLVQFPYSFHYTDENRRHLDRITRSLSGLPLALEFRNEEWVQDRVIEGLVERKAAFVNVDQPELPQLIKPSAHVTADLAYIRFHGRNKQNWWTGDNVSRYDYLYSDEELTDWQERIRLIVKKVRMLLIAFNNHSRGQAVQNARRLKELLLADGIGAE
jgi:uncharacterized protein YecE (DUF72 family)